MTKYQVSCEVTPFLKSPHIYNSVVLHYFIFYKKREVHSASRFQGMSKGVTSNCKCLIEFQELLGLGYWWYSCGHFAGVRLRPTDSTNYYM